VTFELQAADTRGEPLALGDHVVGGQLLQHLVADGRDDDAYLGVVGRRDDLLDAGLGQDLDLDHRHHAPGALEAQHQRAAQPALVGVPRERSVRRGVRQVPWTEPPQTVALALERALGVE
jgi:hypothetical protein